ncbi:pyridoxamine 5'-phosphate oxidase family protein [Arthrobacter sp. efr-133-TYG-104]|uniref:pyridoxamine 5'-phosphate oxidase family protein n=1 Tax=Arthrobacter sp. efr-133-TYG-104 TaxID=3040324 RepID=UPI00254CAA11|nr:pyridoxamine 5'-phosphate oxidase family protein [Arthrobacter sp. efr-133-TYG-104]
MSLPSMDTGRVDGGLHVTDELSQEQCWELLRSYTTGRFGFVQEGRIMILPVNYLVDGQSIYFRTSEDGSISEAVPSLETSFQIDDSRPARSEGWSVLISGPSSRVEDPDLLTRLWGKNMAEPWGGGARYLFIRIQGYRVTGRHVHLG